MRSSRTRLAAVATIAATCLISVPPATEATAVRVASDAQPAAGKFLVARRDMPDPNFARTVILLLDHGPAGALGLVVNRPTDVPLSSLAEAFEGLGMREEPIYRGGPVPSQQPFLLFATDAAEDGASRVFDDVWVSRSLDVLRRLAAGTGKERRTFRLYAGYAGWAPGQLENEIARGDWHVLSADRESVFSERPERVWSALLPPVPGEQARSGVAGGRVVGADGSASDVAVAGRLDDGQRQALAQTAGGG